MLRFRVSRVVPLGGKFFYEVPETKVLLQHPTRSKLIYMIRAHYAENGLDTPANIEALLEDFMCRRMPESFCHGDDEGRGKVRALTLPMIRKNTLALAENNPRVDPGDADVRARICSTCPQNDRTMCPSCVGLTEWARKLSGRTLSGLDSVLGVCRVDCTALSAKVHMSEVPDDETYPDNCWRRK